MGCDIHPYREKFVDGRWQTADEWKSFDYGEDDKGQEVEYEKRAYNGRNYNLFGMLAGVRNRDDEFAVTPRGLPWDVSPEVKAAAEQWDGDGHSHTYLYLHELASLQRMVRSRSIQVSGMMRRDQLAKLQASIASGTPDWKLLYPYCQDTNDPAQTEFRVEVPMEVMVGSCLDQIIASFDKVEGANKRLVFWFDN